MKVLDDIQKNDNHRTEFHNRLVSKMTVWPPLQGLDEFQKWMLEWQ